MLGGLIFVLIGVGGYITSRQSLTAAAWVSHTQEVIASIDEIQAGLLSAESSARGFVLTDNEAFLGVHADAIGRLPGRIARLEVLVQDNPCNCATWPRWTSWWTCAWCRSTTCCTAIAPPG